jgi:hypothetical protein
MHYYFVIAQKELKKQREKLFEKSKKRQHTKT